jgi:hypothetical protein
MIPLTWQGFARFEALEDEALEAQIVGDPSPFVVSMDSPESRTMYFSYYFRRSDQANFLTGGQWNAKLTIEQDGEDPTVNTFCLQFPNYIRENVNQTLASTEETKSRLWRLQIGGLGLERDYPGRNVECYTA